jgi:hypothetical protein
MLNLIDGKDWAFHDRYLLLYPHEIPTKVFCCRPASTTWLAISRLQ